MDWVAHLPPGYVYVLYVFLGRNGTLPVLPLEVQGNILLRWRNHERAEFNYNKAIIFFRKQFPEWPLTIIAEKFVEHKVELMSTPLKDLYWMYKKICSVSDPLTHKTLLICHLRTGVWSSRSELSHSWMSDMEYALRCMMCCCSL